MLPLTPKYCNNCSGTLEAHSHPPPVIPLLLLKNYQGVGPVHRPGGREGGREVEREEGGPGRGRSRKREGGPGRVSEGGRESTTVFQQTNMFATT